MLIQNTKLFYPLVGEWDMITITYNGLMEMQNQKCVNVKVHYLKFERFQKNLLPILSFYSAFDFHKRVILLKKSFSELTILNWKKVSFKIKPLKDSNPLLPKIAK